MDRRFLGIVIALVVVGFLTFTSASLGLLAREGARFSSVAFNQIFFGLGLGGIACFIASRIHYRFWRKHAFYIFGGALLLTILVFVPGIGVEHGGAHRWLNLGVTTFQPAEFLKIAFLIYFATWLSGVKDRVGTFTLGTLPLLSILGITGAILLAQPDTDTFAVIACGAFAMFMAAGGRWRDLLIFILIGITCLSGLALSRPYIKDRLLTFLNPAADPLGAGYQIQQSLIAIGSGQFTGRGFGQSIQKFDYLPEPIGDSIFAVAGEEFGFLGSSLLIILYLAFTFQGLRIAARAPDDFAGLLVVGIVTLIVTASFVNIASMLGVVPLSGLPLLFVSHGGTAMLFTLFSVGIILNISKYQKAV